MKSPIGLESPHMFTEIKNGKEVPLLLFFCSCGNWVKMEDFNAEHECCTECYMEMTEEHSARWGEKEMCQAEHFLEGDR